MRGLSTLIRLAKHELDERRRRLGELQAHQDEFRMKAAVLEARLEAEGVVAQQAGPMGFSFIEYMRVVLKQRDELLKAANGLQPEIDAAVDVVREAFEEVKRLEMVEEAEQREARRKEEAAERNDLDEIGLQRHERRRREAAGEG
ncbi:MAG: hypothetical protein RIB84_19470 [Sneathiellaceae bacterium]